MDFPILDLLDDDESVRWLEKHFHPDGFGCPHCGAARDDAWFFRVNAGSGLSVYRCRQCRGIYNLYSGTVFAGSQLPPGQVLLLLRGVLQGQPSKQMARELGLREKTVLLWRHRLQARAEAVQPTTPLPDGVVESDELFQNAGKKRARSV